MAETPRPWSRLQEITMIAAAAAAAVAARPAPCHAPRHSKGLVDGYAPMLEQNKNNALHGDGRAQLHSWGQATIALAGTGLSTTVNFNRTRALLGGVDTGSASENASTLKLRRIRTQKRFIFC
jgi:hypothetical protein